MKSLQILAAAALFTFSVALAQTTPTKAPEAKNKKAAVTTVKKDCKDKKNCADCKDCKKKCSKKCDGKEKCCDKAAKK